MQSDAVIDFNHHFVGAGADEGAGLWVGAGFCAAVIASRISIKFFGGVRNGYGGNGHLLGALDVDFRPRLDVQRIAFLHIR